MGDEHEVRPALTSEEWEAGAFWRDTRVTTMGGGGTIWIGEQDYATDEEGEEYPVGEEYTFTGPARHALAALCLHGQPYGFTWDHHFAVAHADEPWWRCPEGHWHKQTDDDLRCYICSRPVRSIDEFVDEAAARIAALLPPREP